MRKITLAIPITLDGYIEGPNRELDWVVADDELHDYSARLLKESDLLIFGRVAYQLLASYWPTAASDPKNTPAELNFANAINPLPKIVYSRTLEKVDWNTRIVRSFDPREIRDLKAKPGGNIALSGGAMIAKTFLQHGLVDEIQLIVQPAVIGGGTSLFGGMENSLRLEFKWKQTFRSGAVVLCYHPDGKMPASSN